VRGEDGIYVGWMDENVMRMMGFPNSPPYPPLLQGRSDKGTAALVRASRLPRPLVSAKNMLDVVTFRKVADGSKIVGVCCIHSLVQINDSG